MAKYPMLFTATKCTQQSYVLSGSDVPDIMHISEHSFGHSYSPSLTQVKLILDVAVYVCMHVV